MKTLITVRKRHSQTETRQLSDSSKFVCGKAQQFILHLVVNDTQPPQEIPHRFDVALALRGLKNDAKRGEKPPSGRRKKAHSKICKKAVESLNVPMLYDRKSNPVAKLRRINCDGMLSFKQSRLDKFSQCVNNAKLCCL